MGADKLFMTLGGKPVLARTLEIFQRSACIDTIIIVTREECITEVWDLCRRFCIEKTTAVIPGGATRTQSVLAGVTAAKNANYVAVHDGARPLVTTEIIENTLAAAMKYGAATPGTIPKETIKAIDGSSISATPDRNTLRAVQTPQIFDRAMLYGALTRAAEAGVNYTDDCAAVEAIGMRVHVTEGSYTNIKLTTAEDIVIAEALLAAVNTEKIVHSVNGVKENEQ